MIMELSDLEAKILLAHKEMQLDLTTLPKRYKNENHDSYGKRCTRRVEVKTRFKNYCEAVLKQNGNI